MGSGHGSRVLNRSFTRTRLKKLIEGIDAAIEEYPLGSGTVDAGVTGIPGRNCPVDAESIQHKMDRTPKRKGKLDGFLQECETTTTGQVNLTDRDSLRRVGFAICWQRCIRIIVVQRP